MSFEIFNRLVVIRWSKDWGGWDVGIFSCKVASNPRYGEAKAFRLVVWRLAMWVELK